MLVNLKPHDIVIRKDQTDSCQYSNGHGTALNIWASPKSPTGYYHSADIREKHK